LQAAPAPQFGRIVFCEDVTEWGLPVNPAEEFPTGTAEVRALFSHRNMPLGQNWGWLWEVDGAAHRDARDMLWEGSKDGWTDIRLEEGGAPLEPGQHTFVLFLDGRVVQEASFVVAGSTSEETVPTAGPASFGSITFAEGVTDDHAPIRPGTRFPAGTTEVYAVYTYQNMSRGHSWAREWLLSDRVLAFKQEAWQFGTDSIGHCSLTSQKPLEPGRYTLNLYIDGQLASSSNFVVLAPPDWETPTPEPEELPPARPEELIDPEMMLAWQLLADSANSTLRDLVQFLVDHRIEVRVSDDVEEGVACAYRYFIEEPMTPGWVVVRRAYYDRAQTARLSACLAHELTHAVWRLAGAGEPTKQEEFNAYVAGFFAAAYIGGTDLMQEYGWFALDENGEFSETKLWEYICKMYPEFPDGR